MTNVTKVTTGRILTDDDYREIYEELEGDGTPHTVVKRIGEPPTAAAWYKWRKGDGPLTANMQAKLRAAHGITTVMDACATASETATVYQVGEGAASTVVLVAGALPVALRVNGAVTAAELPTTSFDTYVTPVTPTPKRTHIEAYRPMLDPEDRHDLESLSTKRTAKEIWQLGINAARALEVQP